MICKQCKQKKQSQYFYKHPQMTFGYLNICKECKKEYARNNRSKESDKKRYMENPKRRLFIIYGCIIKRCYDVDNKKYKDYGGRGITCLRNNYKEFIDDMLCSYIKHYDKHYKEGHRNTSIDRIDNDGNYCKENCRWATYKEQANNRRR